LDFFELAPSLCQRLDPSRLLHAINCPEPMQVLPEWVPSRSSPEQLVKSRGYDRTSKWSHRIFRQRLSFLFLASCERHHSD
jgi:hypothetical protein